MFPDRSSTKDYVCLNSPDQESLLRSDGSEEKLLPSIPPLAKRNQNLKTYLHIAAIVFYSFIAVLLFVWSTRLNAQICDCENVSISSPANPAVKYQQQTIVHKLADKNKYRGPPRPEVDEAWEELLQYNNIRVQKDELEDANLTSVPLSDEKGGYLASLDVFHTLHCVNNIRKAYYNDYYQDPGPVESQHEHFDHCVDLLREVLMCHGDVSLHTYGWKDEYPRPWPSMQTAHQCRNWDELVKWSKDRAVSDLSGPILTHPTLGISYPKENTPA